MAKDQAGCVEQKVIGQIEQVSAFSVQVSVFCFSFLTPDT
jgi:hypothetical protein